MNDFNFFLNFCLTELLSLVPEKLFLVGGYVRERLMLKETTDFDFAVSENTLEIAKELARKTKGVFVLLDDQRKTARVVWNKKRNNFELNFDLATITGNSIEDDLLLRDLTINSMAIGLNKDTLPNLFRKNYSFNKNEITDPAGGFSDLKNKIIRTYRKENLEADPLRLLRVFRFSAKLGFEITTGTLNFIKEIPELILIPARERVLKEFFDIISNPFSYKQLELMNEVKLLLYLFQGLGNSDQGSFSLAIKNLETFELIINNIPENFNYNKDISIYLNEIVILDHKKYSILKIALFLNSLKPENCNINAYLLQVENFLKIYTFSFVEQQLILNHLKFCHFYQEIDNFEFNRKPLFYFFKERQNEVIGSLLINYTLAFAKNSLKENIGKIFEYYFEDNILSQQPKLLDGNVLIREFKLKPGPIIGKLLNSLQEAQAEKKVTNYQEALEFISGKLKINNY